MMTTRMRWLPILAATALAVALWSLAGAGPCLAGEQGTKVVFADEPLPPYNLGDLGGLSQGGISHDLMAEVFGRMGLEFELQMMPWARALKSAEFGQVDGLPLLMKNAEREAYLVFTDPVVENRELFYYLPDRLGDFSWGDFSDLKGRSIGLINGYIYDEGFLQAIDEQGIRVTRSQDIEDNMRLLLAGRVDLILEDETMVGPMFAAHPDWAARIRAARKPVSSYYWYMAVSRKSWLADRVGEINQVLADMRRDGTLDAILGGR